MKPQPAFGPFLVIGPISEPIKEKIQNFKTAQGKPEAGFLANKILGVVEVGQGGFQIDLGAEGPQWGSQLAPSIKRLSRARCFGHFAAWGE